MDLSLRNEDVVDGALTVDAGIRGWVRPERRGARAPELAARTRLVLHLVRRELVASHRGTVLGWMWPLVRQLVQLAVLVLVFSRVLDLGIEDYPVFVFSGLITWTWFASGMSSAARSVVVNRHFVFQPGFPPILLPMVAVVVPLVDVLPALPVLGGMVLLNDDGLQWTIVALPALMIVQLLLMTGLACLVSAVTVYLRDVPNLVGLVLMLGFYVTPVYFALGKVPPEYQSVLQYNPMATLLEAYRAILIGDAFPPVGLFVGVVALSAAAGVVGCLVFRRLQPGFVDEL